MTASHDSLDQLPELPPETADVLERSGIGPYLTTRPPRIETRPPSIPTPVPEKRTSHRVRHHFAWATYPKVVCHDPGPFTDGLEIAPAVESDLGLGLPGELTEVQGAQHYRLSSWEGRTFPRPLWCTVTRGPWAADFREEESCYVGLASTWEFRLVGVDAPGAVAAWTGNDTDMPDVPGLTVIWGTMQHGQWGDPTDC